MADTKYCLCCDSMVPVNYLERDNKKEVTCAYCGFTLDVQKLWESSQKTGEGYALVAEDSKPVKDLIIKVLSKSRFSENLMAFDNGLELITDYSKLIAKRATIDIVIIDLNMPVMDGLTAARTIRTIEKQHNVPPVPIVFFSAVKADDSLKSQMELLQPASYMNKGSDPDMNRLSQRVEQLVSYLIEKYKK